MGSGIDRPARVGRYELLERLAVGGMGEIFLARETGVAGFERLVVVKRLLPSIAGEDERVDLFIDEARVAANLSHPNIVSVYDFGRDEEGFYIAMEYVAGHNLARIVSRAREQGQLLPRHLSVHVVAELARALDYAHAATDARGAPLDLVHRDVNPQNTLVSYEGDVKLLDFGIAKAANALHRTEAGTLRGKYGYMAPEQLTGGPIDRRADVFALGVLLWELTTGEALFRGRDPLEAIERLRHRRVPPPRARDPDYPEDLQAAVMSALAKERELRTPSAGDLARQLTDHLEQSGVTNPRAELARWLGELLPAEAVPPGRAADTAATVAERPSRPTSSTRWWPALVAVVLAAVATIVGASWWIMQDDGQTAASTAADDGLEGAWIAAGRGAYGQVRTMLEDRLQEDPDDAAATMAAALAHWWLGSSGFQSLAVRARQLGLPPGDRAAMEGLYLLDIGRGGEAIAFLREQVARRPQDGALAYVLGEVLWHEQRRAEAVAELERALELDARWTVAAHHLVEYYLSIDSPQRLAPVIERLERIDPVAAAAAAAARAMAARDYGGAIARLDEIGLEADEPMLWIRRAQALALDGRFDDSATAARRAFDLDPVDDREDAGLAHWSESFLYRDDLEGFRDALGARLTRARMLVRALWLGADDIGAPAPVRLDRQGSAPGQSRMTMPPLWAALILMGARDPDAARAFYRDYPAAEIRAFGAGLDAEGQGDWATAAGHYQRALDTPAIGEVRMLLAYHLARARAHTGDQAAAATACAEVVHPRVYAPYRAVLLPDCRAMVP